MCHNPNYEEDDAERHFVYSTSYYHTQRSASMLETSCLKSLPPAQLHNPIYRVFSFVASNGLVNCFATSRLCFFVLPQESELNEGENTNMHIIVSRVETYTGLLSAAPRGPHSFAWNSRNICVCTSPHQEFSKNCLYFVWRRLWNVEWMWRIEGCSLIKNCRHAFHHGLQNNTASL